MEPTAPEAAESIWYNVPFYKRDGAELAGFSVHKAHVSFGFGPDILPPEGGLAVRPGVAVKVTFGAPIQVVQNVGGVEVPRPIDDLVAEVRAFLEAHAALARG